MNKKRSNEELKIDSWLFVFAYHFSHPFSLECWMCLWYENRGQSTFYVISLVIFGVYDFGLLCRMHFRFSILIQKHCFLSCFFRFVFAQWKQIQALLRAHTHISYGWKEEQKKGAKNVFTGAFAKYFKAVLYALDSNGILLCFAAGEWFYIFNYLLIFLWFKFQCVFFFFFSIVHHHIKRYSELGHLLPMVNLIEVRVYELIWKKHKKAQTRPTESRHLYSWLFLFSVSQIVFSL